MIVIFHPLKVVLYLLYSLMDGTVAIFIRLPEETHDVIARLEQRRQYVAVRSVTQAFVMTVANTIKLLELSNSKQYNF